MKSNIFRRWLCIIIAISMIVSGSLVPCGNITGAYALSGDSQTEELAEDEDNEFAGGKGTKEDPYEIATVEQLSNIKHHLKDTFYYELTKDLDFNNVDGENNSYEDVYGDQWVAIGTDPTYFSFQGHLDGNGHSISNMNITSGTSTGIFGYCNGTVVNLKVINSNITTTGNAAGAIAGELCAGGVIDRCAVVGGSIAAAKHVGGLVGVAYKGTKISNVYVDDVEIGLDYMFLANKIEDPLLGGINGPDGLEGYSSTTPIDFFRDALGIAGTVVDIGLDISAALSGDFGLSNMKKYIDNLLGFVNGDFIKTIRTSTAGGIVGFMSGELKNAWVYTRAGQNDYAGSWVVNAEKWWESFVTDSDTTGWAGWTVPHTGPIVGRNFHATIENAFETDASHSNLDNIFNRNYIYSKSGWFKDANKVPRIYPIDGEMPPEKINSFNNPPMSDALPRAAVKPTKDKDEDGIYDIYNAYELAYIEYEGWLNYELMNDIYLSDCGDPTHKKCTLNKEKVAYTLDGINYYTPNCIDWGYWIPLCRDRDQYFDGNFYGNGHTIYGLKVATNDAGGLFGYVLGDIMDLNVYVDKIDAYGPAGGLATGVFYPGNIYRCSVVGPNGLAGNDEWDINGGANPDGAGVGGLVGYIGKDVEVKDCYTVVNVSNSNWEKFYEIDVVGTYLKILFPSLRGNASEFIPAVEDIEEYNNQADKRQKGLSYITENGASLVKDKLQQKVDQYNIKIQQEMNELAETEEQLKIGQNEQAEAQKNLDEAQKELDASKKEFDDAKKELDDAKKANDENSTDETKARLKAAENDYNNKETGYNNKKTDYDNKNKTLKEKKENVNSITEAKKQLNDKVAENKDIRDRIDKKKADVDAKIEQSKTADKATKTALIFKVIGIITTVLKGTAEGAYNYSDIIYENRLGGFAGDCRGRIINCYSAGKVFTAKKDYQETFVGGFVGRTRTGDSDLSDDGTLMGVSEMLQNCYYFVNAGYGGEGTPLTFSQMQDEDNYVGFDFTTVWSRSAQVNNNRPYLDYEKYVKADEIAHGFAGGDGSESDPFIIKNMDQFMLISDLWYMDYHYKLDTDLEITLSAKKNKYNRTYRIVEINGVLIDRKNGKEYDNGRFLYGSADDHNGFQGHFDGDGHKIIFRLSPVQLSPKLEAFPGYSQGSFGLFPKVGGSIRNLEISGLKSDEENAYGEGSRDEYNIDAGMLCSTLTSGGIIENIKISNCTVTGVDAAASLAAYVEEGAIVRNVIVENVEIIRDAYGLSTCEVAGLVVGQNNGTVEDVLIYDSRISESDSQVAIHNNLGTAERIYIKDKNPTEKTAVNGFDFAHTWTMEVDEDNNPTGIALRSMRSTNIPDMQSAFNQSGLEGKGTEAEPFLISSVANLNTIGDLLKKCPNDLAGIYFKQTANIDCSERDSEGKLKFNFNTIRKDGKPFNGIYDGDGYTITLLNKSLFKYIDGAIIKNLAIQVSDTMQGTDIAYAGLGVGILSCRAKNSLIFNCSIERDNQKENADLAIQGGANNVAYGGIAGDAVNCNIINCKSEALIAVPSNGSKYGMIAGEISKTESYNGSIVGLEDSIKPAVINCAYDCRYGNFKIMQGVVCNKAIGNIIGTLLSNVGTCIPEEQLGTFSYFLNGRDNNISLETLNNTEELPDVLAEEAYIWKYNEDTDEVTLKPGICKVTIQGTENVSIEKIYKVTVQENRDTWEQIPVYDKYSYTASVRNGTKLVVEVSDKAEKAGLRWELRDARTNSIIEKNRYVQQEDINGDEIYGENELLDSSVVEFVVDQDMTVYAYDESDREVTGLYVSTAGAAIEVSEYEQLTVSALRAKGVMMNVGYNYGYSEAIDPQDTKVSIYPEYFTEAGTDQTVTVSYIHEGREYEKEFKVNVIPRVMKGIEVYVPAWAPGITNIQEYQTIDGKSLYDAGLRFRKVYNFGPEVEIEGDELSKITAEPVSCVSFGIYQVYITYTEGDKEYKAQSGNISIIPRAVTGIIVSRKSTVSSIDFQAYQPITAVNLKDSITVHKLYLYGPMVEMSEAEKTALAISINDGSANNYFTEVGDNKEITITYSNGTQNFTDTLDVKITPRVLKELNVKTTGDVAFAEYQTITAADLNAKGVSFEKVYEYGSPVTIAATQSGLSYTLIGVPAGQQYFTGTETRQIKATYTENDKTVEKNFTISLAPRVMNGIDAVTNSGYAPVEFQAYESITVDKLYEKGVTINQTYPDGPGEILWSEQKQYLSVSPSQFTTTGTQTLTITYSNDNQTFEDTLDVNITKPVKSIEVGKTENVTSVDFQQNEQITVDELFDRGMEVTLKYEYASDEQLPESERQCLSVSPSQFTTTGNQSVKITYSKDNQTFTAYLTVNITSKVLDELIVQTAGTPSFSEYQSITAASLSTKGVVFKKKYEYGDPVNVTATDSNLSIELKNVPEGQQYFTGTGNKQVKVSYTENEKTVTKTITVDITAKVVSGISIEKNPDKLTYNKGENINLSGGKLSVSYQNTDHTDAIDMTASGVTVEGYNKDVTGTYNVYIRYNGVRSETSFQVTVKDDTYTIKPAQAGFTLASQPGTKQNESGVLWVKNNLQQKNGGNTRRAYVKFDLNGLKEYMAENYLEIDSAELSYSAKIDRTGTGSRTIYVKKVKEAGWTNADLTWKTAPVFEGDIANATATVSDTQYQKKTADITAYLNSRISSGSATATLGFEVSQCGGEVIGISNTTSNKPTLIVKFKEQVNISIDESSPSNKPVTSYTIGDNLDLTKGRIKVTYADGREPEYVVLDNPAVSVTGYNENKLGPQTLTVKYQGEETSYTVTVKDKITSVVVDLTYIKPKLDYSINESLSKAGVAFVTYASGTKKNVMFYDSRITIQGYKANVPGEQTLTVIYTDENGVTGSGTYKVTVHDAISSIAFVANSMPQINYIQGQQTLIRSQGTIKVTYASGRTENIPFNDSKVTVSGYNKDQVGEQNIKVVYEGKETSYTVYVNKPANQIADLNIQFKRAVTGQNLSLSSAKVVRYTGTLANTQTSNITDTNNIKISGFDKSKGGNQTITVTYREYSEQMTVYVYTKKTETIKIGVSKANHSKKTGSLAALTSNGYVKNNGNNTMETYIKMSLIDLQIIENRDIQDFKIKSARLKFQAKGYGNSTTSRRLQLYKVNHMSDSALNNGGKSLSWSNGRLKDAIGSYWCVNKDTSRNANWDVTAYVKERYENAASVLFGFGLTQNDGNKEVRILDVYDASKTYLEVTVEYLQ